MYLSQALSKSHFGLLTVRCLRLGVPLFLNIKQNSNFKDMMSGYCVAIAVGNSGCKAGVQFEKLNDRS